MTRGRNAVLSMVALLCLVIPSLALAEQIEISRSDVSRKCGTPLEAEEVTAPDQDQIEAWIGNNQIAAGGVIPVNFHVIYNGSEGNVPESQLDAQITVMNYHFAGKDYNGNPVPGARNTGYTFVKNSVTRTNSRKWFGMTPGSGNETNAKNALVVNPTGSLNFYTCKPGQGLLGWATFPWNLAGAPNKDGVVVHYGSLPGGGLAPYNLGGTGTHEVGHWVGLYHTFQGGCHSDATCSTAGDLVCDTPAQATSTSGCPIGKESCTSSAGPDPIHNYMDYSYDSCYNNFTAGQDARADYMMSTYRPVIGSAAPGVILAGFDSGIENGAREGLRMFARPNPFAAATTIQYTLSRDANITLKVFDLSGRLVSTLVDDLRTAGDHSAVFDGSGLPNGVYFYVLNDGQSVTKNRLMLVR